MHLKMYIKMHKPFKAKQSRVILESMFLVFTVSMHLQVTKCLQFKYTYSYNGLYVTVFWKTDYLDTRTKIHLLPVRDRHTHALSRNIKH